MPHRRLVVCVFHRKLLNENIKKKSPFDNTANDFVILHLRTIFVPSLHQRSSSSSYWPYSNNRKHIFFVYFTSVSSLNFDENRIETGVSKHDNHRISLKSVFRWQRFLFTSLHKLHSDLNHTFPTSRLHQRPTPKQNGYIFLFFFFWKALSFSTECTRII